MARRRLAHVVAIGLAVLPSAAAAGPGCAQDAAPRPSFVVTNGVRLHALDWGGTGPTLLFLLPGGGDLIEQFGTLAPQFTDRFRVLGLTRRGLAPSETPTSGYDSDTLVADILGFLEAMGVRQAHVAGHSIAGAEMTRLAATRPSRVLSLVYLDAANDYKASAELAAEAGFGLPDDPAVAAVLRGAAARHPEYERVQAPALNIAVVFDGPIPVRPDDDAAYKRFVRLAQERDLVGSHIAKFRRGMKRGEVLLLRNTTHAGFLNDLAQQQVFVPVMREFLLRGR
jgi:pimeloyl-ACP methyl ester carboxylesterase